ncbi:MAG: chloride channel protein [Candidatus Krumholzibacteriia bacterium]
MTPRARFLRRLRHAVYAWQLRLSPDETTLMMIMASLVGVIGGFGAILFRWLVSLGQGLVLGHGDHTVALLGQISWWHTLLLPVIGAVIVGPMIHFLAREARGHGVPEVIGAIVFRGGVIRPIVAAVKIVASAITIACGGSVGREGPIVQIGASMASTIGQLMHFSPQRLRTMIGCGAAAGIAATFNAPIAGAFFALEILLRDFAVGTFAPIVVSSVIATAVSRHYLGDTPAFPVPGFQMHGPLELPFYLLLGLVVGLMSVIYVRSLYFAEEKFDAIPIPPYLKPLLAALPLGVMFLWFPQVYGVGYPSMVEALDGNMDLALMAGLIGIKLVAVCLTLGAGYSGGVFAPALFLGGMTGGAFGAMANLVWPDLGLPVGAFAMVGMAAMVGAATGGPLTAILILFEMTGEYRVILPLMLTSVAAALVHRSLLDDSIFTLKFTRQGQRLDMGRESAILRQYHAEDIMDVIPETIPLDAPLNLVIQCFLESDREHFYITEPDGRLAGRISIHDVKDILHERKLNSVILAADLMTQPAGVVYRADSLEDCLLMLGVEDVTDLPVLNSREKPHLVGVVTRKAIFEVYNREVLNQEDKGIKLVHGQARMRDCVDLPEAYKVQVLYPPAAWLGRTLRDLGLRQNYQISVLAVKHQQQFGAGQNELPEPDLALEPGDRLVIVGHADQLDRLLDDCRRASGSSLPGPDPAGRGCRNHVTLPAARPVGHGARPDQRGTA